MCGDIIYKTKIYGKKINVIMFTDESSDSQKMGTKEESYKSNLNVRFASRVIITVIINTYYQLLNIVVVLRNWNIQNCHST